MSWTAAGWRDGSRVKSHAALPEHLGAVPAPTGGSPQPLTPEAPTTSSGLSGTHRHVAYTQCRHTEVNSIKRKKIQSCLIPVSGTVHGLQGELLLLHLKGEHVLAVVLPVARGHPEAAIEDVGSHDLLESSSPVFTLLEQNTHTEKSMLTLVEGEKNYRVKSQARISWTQKFHLEVVYQNSEIQLPWHG